MKIKDLLTEAPTTQAREADAVDNLQALIKDVGKMQRSFKDGGQLQRKLHAIGADKDLLAEIRRALIKAQDAIATMQDSIASPKQ